MLLTVDKTQVLLPEPYLTAIGRVCVQWSTLEQYVGLMLQKLLGFDLTDYRPRIITTHMAWPMKMNILEALIDSHKERHKHLEAFADVKPLLTEAAIGRNKIVHAFWGYENDQANIMKATARGKLKTDISVITVPDIDAIADNIGTAAVRLYRVILDV